MQKPIIALFESHDTTLAVYDFEQDDVFIIDLEKITSTKHFWFWNVAKSNDPKKIKDDIERCNAIINCGLYYLEAQFGIKNDFSAFVFRSYRKNLRFFDLDIIKADKQIIIDGGTLNGDRHYHHHLCHAFSSFAQSPAKEAFCLTWDGVGDDAGFCTTKIDESGNVEEFQKYVYDFGHTFNKCGQKLDPLESKSIIDVPGKLMGYSAYGKECDKTDEWISMFRKSSRYKLTLEDMEKIETPELRESRIDGSDRVNRNPNGTIKAMRNVRAKLWTEAGLTAKKLNSTTSITENFAYASQKFMEDSFIEVVEDFRGEIERYSNNLVLSGGCSLNVICNEKVRKEFPDLNVYVGVCVNDSGLSFGLLYKYMLDENIITADKRFDVRYGGMRIYDNHSLNICSKMEHNRKVDAKKIAELLRRGKIVGLVQGRHEFGPRALGNRSILCDASFPEMKHVLNQKVKNREWYRPYAPVCRREDAPRYFNAASFDNLEFMSYAVDVKDEYQDVFPCITHIDGTARLQTVTEESNKLLYDILGDVSGVLLNTSLNVQGKPICNRFQEALDILKTTEMDYLVVENEEKDLLLFEAMALPGD